MNNDATLSPDQSAVLRTISENLEDRGSHHRALTHTVIAQSLPKMDEVTVLRATEALHSLGFIEISGMERNPNIDGVTDRGRTWLATG